MNWDWAVKAGCKEDDLIIAENIITTTIFLVLIIPSELSTFTIPCFFLILLPI